MIRNDYLVPANWREAMDEALENAKTLSQQKQQATQLKFDFNNPRTVVLQRRGLNTIPANQPNQQQQELTNPKDLEGQLKVSFTKVPSAAVAHCAHAMMNGAAKYGPYNWRDKRVVASIYVDAAMRHLASWFEGEEVAKDSGVHHLGHAMACCAILLDALEGGGLGDDRPTKGHGAKVLDRLNGEILRRAQPMTKGAE